MQLCGAQSGNYNKNSEMDENAENYFCLKLDLTI